MQIILEFLFNISNRNFQKLFGLKRCWRFVYKFVYLHLMANNNLYGGNTHKNLKKNPPRSHVTVNQAIRQALLRQNFAFDVDHSLLTALLIHAHQL